MCHGSASHDGVGTPQEVRELHVYAYFRQHGLDPSHLDPEFIPHWIKAGKTAEQIFSIATNTRMQES